MDACVTLPSSKKQELSKDRAIDVISKFPDHILHHVFSFLSTKDVIRTSAVSKRWKNLWTSTANIELKSNNLLEESQGNFTNFVTRVLTLHGASTIKRLRLRLDLPPRFPLLNLWITVALEHNIEELGLVLGSKQQDGLTCWLFTCHSLIFLKRSARLTLKCPSSTYLINLKKLCLASLTFSDDESTKLLFSNCPVLEELTLENCDWKNIQSVSISIPTLRSFTFAVSNRTKHASLINILSSNITYLHCSTDFTVNLRICDLPSLERAFVDVPHPEMVMEGLEDRAQTIFSSIHNVEILRISHEVMWYMEFEDLWNHVPMFYKLTQLDLGSDIAPYHNYLMKFLLKTPNLENLNIFETSCEDEDWFLGLKEDGLEVPSCISSSLKIFSNSYSNGRQEEIILASFVLRNAINLERMTIYGDGNLSEDGDKWILLKNHLNEVKVSESCVIELHKD